MRDNTALIERVREGDKQAENRMVEENMGLVYSIARRFLNRGYDAEDLTQTRMNACFPDSVRKLSTIRTIYDGRYVKSCACLICILHIFGRACHNGRHRKDVPYDARRI